MKNFVKMVLKYHYTFIVMALFILIMGIVTIFKTPIDIFPEIDTPVVTAVWTYTGMQAKDIERRIVTIAERAYASNVNGIERIESSRGKVLYSASRPRITKVLSSDTAATMTAMLRTVIEHGTGMAANIGRPAAGKTGTTDDYKDAWFVGYTPSVVMGVWVGNDDNTKMGGLTGGTVPALIWRDIMRVAAESIGSDDFQYPEISLDGSGKKSNPKLTSSDSRKNSVYKDSPVDKGPEVFQQLYKQRVFL